MFKRYFLMMMVVVSTILSAIIPITANAAINVTDLATEISGNAASLNAVMAAILGLIVLVVGFNLLKRILK